LLIKFPAILAIKGDGNQGCSSAVLPSPCRCLRECAIASNAPPNQLPPAWVALSRKTIKSDNRWSRNTIANPQLASPGDKVGRISGSKTLPAPSRWKSARASNPTLLHRANPLESLLGNVGQNLRTNRLFRGHNHVAAAQTGLDTNPMLCVNVEEYPQPTGTDEKQSHVRHRHSTGISIG